MMVQLRMRADDMELIGPVHGVVDGRVVVDGGEGARHLGRPWHDPADMAVVEALRRGEVVRMLGRAGRLVAVERSPHVLAGSAARAAACASTQSSIEASELASTSAFSPAGRRTACSAASIPPQDWPSSA